MTSVIFEAAAARWAELRAEFELYREQAYRSAEAATNGNLLNARGRSQHVNPWSLFIGSTDRAYLYASDELRDFWREHPRMTFAEFERQRWDGTL